MIYIRDKIRQYIMYIRYLWLSNIWGHDIKPTTIVSMSAYLDKTHPSGIILGKYTLVARGAIVLSHDFTRSFRGVTKIGDFCLVGTNAIVLPGVTIGDHVVVGAGSVVTKDVPANSLIAGNPAKVLKQINTANYGRMVPVEE